MEFTAPVIEGEGRGKKIGFPTINLSVPNGFSLPPGVYAGRALVAGKWFKAALHWGPNQTFAAREATFEVHLIDFGGKLKQDLLRVQIGPYLRTGQKFASARDLAVQIALDIKRCRAL